MQEVVKLRLTITRLEMASIHRQTLGLTFMRWVLFSLNVTIPTDHLLLSEEAVRVLDTKA